MTDELESLERQIARLRTAVRQAVAVGDRAQARALRAELRRAQEQWDEAVEQLDESAPQAAPAATAPSQTGPLLPIREQVHQALTLLGGPAAPRLILTVHRAFFAGHLIPARLTSIRRDEERSFRAAPHARALLPVRRADCGPAGPGPWSAGCLDLAAGPACHRPLSPRVDYLTAAIRVADFIRRLPDVSPDAHRLLWRVAANIPGVPSGTASPGPADVARAARAELAVHEPDDDAHRRAAAAARSRAARRCRPALRDHSSGPPRLAGGNPDWPEARTGSSARWTCLPRHPNAARLAVGQRPGRPRSLRHTTRGQRWLTPSGRRSVSQTRERSACPASMEPPHRHDTAREWCCPPRTRSGAGNSSQMDSCVSLAAWPDSTDPQLERWSALMYEAPSRR